MKKLIANQSIWYKGKLYVRSQELPTDSPEYVDAWLECGSAQWSDDEDAFHSTINRAQMVTAEPGLPGTAVGSDADSADQDLVGKVPETKARKKAKGKE